MISFPESPFFFHLFSLNGFECVNGGMIPKKLELYMEKEVGFNVHEWNGSWMYWFCNLT